MNKNACFAFLSHFLAMWQSLHGHWGFMQNFFVMGQIVSFSFSQRFSPS